VNTFLCHEQHDVASHDHLPEDPAGIRMLTAPRWNFRNFTAQGSPAPVTAFSARINVPILGG